MPGSRWTQLAPSAEVWTSAPGPTATNPAGPPINSWQCGRINVFSSDRAAVSWPGTPIAPASQNAIIQISVQLFMPILHLYDVRVCQTCAHPFPDRDQGLEGSGDSGNPVED